MNLVATDLPGVLIIVPKVFGDARGFFLESWHRDRYASHGVPADLVQDNQAYSRHGVLRGLHIQHPYSQGKLVQVVRGEVFDVAVDLRLDSPWFGRWVGVYLSGENKRQLWVPEGFAHGYYVTAEEALLSYKCSDYYHPETELCVRWDDPQIGIEWPLEGEPALSPKDLAGLRLGDIPTGRLPVYEGG
ncbi:MAG: dTDP-4-dehydrorhamnose 3,5-epimerase [Chromatiaceae bacterium]